MSDNPTPCPFCGTDNPPGSKQCDHCLNPLPGASSYDPTQKTKLVDDHAAPGADFSPGSLIANRYEVIGELGRGGMGTVYLVKDDKLARKEVALKIISPGLVAAPEMRKRFIQEVLSAQELTHESIVKVFHLDEYQGLQFFTMEYLPGSSLREVMQERFNRNELFSLDEAQAVLSPVLSALTHAHARGVIHRDLKPENIVIKGDLPDITVTVLDFGLARIMSPSRMTSSALAMGTAYYMSPEQLSGKGEVDERADLFSVGVVLYELVTGQIPSGRFKLPGELFSGFPQAIDDIVDKALATLSDERFQDAKSFLTALEHLTQAESTQSEQVLQAEREQARLAEEERKRREEAARQAELERQRLAEEERKRKAEEATRKAELERQKQAELERQRKEEEERMRQAGILPPRSPSRGQVWKEPHTGMEFVWVPGGCFDMGCGSWTDQCNDDEKPVHEVCVNGFWMGKYEVTQGQWQKVMGSTVREQRDKANPSWSLRGEGSNHPMYYVSWNEAQDYIRRMNSQSSASGFRLPTEAEWEYACRGGGRKEKYCGGNNVNSVAWYDGNSSNTTHPVGRKDPNALGIYDMSGNVWEWVQDVFDSKAYSRSGRGDNPVVSGGGSSRVLRGGSWSSLARYCRAAFRINYTPGLRFYDMGFRVALSPGQQ